MRRDLISVLQPTDEYLDNLVAGLAEAWWAKVRWLRTWPKVLAREFETRRIDPTIEATLGLLIRALSLRSRKWYYRLTKALGGPISSPADLRMRIESRLAIFRDRANGGSAEQFGSGARESKKEFFF